MLPAFLSMSLVFHIGWLGLAFFYFNTASKAGCSSYASDSRWLIALASVLAIVSSAGTACVLRDLTTGLVFGVIWQGLLFLSIFALGLYLSSEQALLDSLGSWSLEDRPVPVWVGEFSTGTPDDPAFRWLWGFIHDQHKLDFAYWAFNGRKWTNGIWDSESFGLANDQYTHWRFSGFHKLLFDS